MIDKKISVSEQVDNLSTEAKLIYTWSIPHTDDLGLLPYSHKTLKALLIPMWDMRLDTFGNHLEDILKQGLYEVFEHNGEKFFRLVNFFNHQTLKRDRNPNTYLNDIKNWKEADGLGFHLEYNENPSKGKLREVKGNKGKLIQYSPKSLELAKLLFNLIKDQNPAWNNKPNWDKWADGIDKIVRLDKRTFEQIEIIIRWCQKDPFWHQNILSPDKLRKQFNQLVVKAGSQGKEVVVI